MAEKDAHAAGGPRPSHARHSDTGKRDELLARLQTTAAEIEATIAAIADGLIVCDNRGTIIRTNAAADRLMGFSAAEREMSSRERSASILLTDENGAPFAPGRNPIQRALAGETVAGAVVSIGRPKGETRWLSCAAAQIHGADGTATGVIATMTNVTPLRQLQDQRERLLAEVSHTAGQLEAIVTAIADGLIVYDQDGQIVRWNEAAQRLLADLDRELAHRQARQPRMRYTWADGTPMTNEVRLWPVLSEAKTILGAEMGRVRPDGQRVWFTSSCAPVRARDGACRAPSRR